MISGCTCIDFLNENGNGNCNTHDEYFCYVEQPTNCTDAEYSVEVPGKQWSEHACKLINSNGKRNTFKVVHFSFKKS